MIEPDLVGVYKRQVIRPKTLAIENGSVTTLLRMIAGLETPDDGENERSTCRRRSGISALYFRILPFDRT